MNNTIIVLDFGSQYTQLIARRLREQGVYTEILPFSAKVEEIKAKKPKGIILSGGPASVYASDAYFCDEKIFKLKVPILGVCYGMQLIAHVFGAQVAPASHKEYGKAELSVTKTHPLFTDTPEKQIVWMSHSDLVKNLPNGFEAIATSENSPYCVFGDEKRKFSRSAVSPRGAAQRVWYSNFKKFRQIYLRLRKHVEYGQLCQNPDR